MDTATQEGEADHNDGCQKQDPGYDHSVKKYLQGGSVQMIISKYDFHLRIDRQKGKGNHGKKDKAPFRFFVRSRGGQILQVAPGGYS